MKADHYQERCCKDLAANLTTGTAKFRVFDDRLPGFIAEKRRLAGTTFYFR